MARDLRLLDYKQSIDEVGADDAYQIIPFAGEVAPLIVRQDNTVRILSQSGEAIAWGAYLNAPAQLVADAPLLERAKIKYERVGPKEYKTTWSYVMALAEDDEYDVFAATRWPTSPATTPGFTTP